METEQPTLPNKTLVLVAFVQGLALLSLYQWVESGHWSKAHSDWLFGLYGMSLIGPTMWLLANNRENSRAILPWIVVFTMACGALGYYTGSQVTPLEHIRYDWALEAALVITLVIATFKALMYIQQRGMAEAPSYHQLFLFSWRNFLILGLSLLFTLCVWGVLVLWAQLFNVIDISFFEEIFEESWFYYPVLATANGLGIIIFRRHTNIIDTLTRVQQTLMKFLLVIIVFVSLLFLSALVFTGLEPLWKTGVGSNLILWMQALILFFLNAVYQDEPKTRPYPLVIHRFIYIGVALLPVYSAIVFYGIDMRVEQYGWSISRLWGTVIWGIFAFFSFGYLWGIIKYRDNWLGHLSWVNVRMGLLVLITMLLVSSPLSDFRKLTVKSQLDRLNDGVVKIEDFDVTYFRYDLAGPGYAALQRIKREYADTHPKIVTEIEQLYAASEELNAPTKDEFVKGVEIIPNQDVPRALLDAVYQKAKENEWRFKRLQNTYLLGTDLDQDSIQDFVYVEKDRTWAMVTLFTLEDGHWANYAMSSTENFSDDELALIENLTQADVSEVQPQWQNLKIGEMVFQVNTKDRH